MGLNTKIQWATATLSPLRVRVKQDAAEIARSKGYKSLVQIATKMAGHVGPHCERVSHGCDICYSDSNNGRCLPSNGTGLPFDRRSRDLVEPFVDMKALMQPMKWRKPQTIFLENQSDLFGEWYPNIFIYYVLAVASQTPEHEYLILTKRPERARDIFNNPSIEDFVDESAGDLEWCHANIAGRWPLPNIRLGVSVEDQKTADERIPILRRTLAAGHFVSYEPALAYVDFAIHLDIGRCKSLSPDGQRCGLPENHGEKHSILTPTNAPWFGMHPIDQIIFGGESGPRSRVRPCNMGWFHRGVDQCDQFGVAPFVKQMGSRPTHDHVGSCYGKNGQLLCNWPADHEIRLRDRKGGDPSEWHPHLRRREFPKAAKR